MVNRDGSDELELADIRRLTDALLLVSSMRDASTRAMCLDLLERELGHPLDVPWHERARVHVLHIVSACLEHPGAARLLVNVLGTVEGESIQAAALADLVEEVLPKDVLAYRDRRALFSLLRRVAVDDVVTIYEAAVGPLGPVLDADPRNLVAVLRLLERLNCRPDGLPPAFAFVEALAGVVPDALARSLRAWSSSAAPRSHAPLDALLAFRETVSPADVPRRRPTPRPGSYLVVQLQHHGAAPDRFLLSIWSQFGSQLDAGDRWPPRTGEREGGLGEIQEWVDDLVIEARRTWAYNTSLTLEFVLPRELLSLPVDGWLLQRNSAVRQQLGVEHPVVIRSMERLHDRGLHHRWWPRWRWFQIHCHRRDLPEDAVLWLNARGPTSPEVLQALLASADSPVCLVFPWEPESSRRLASDEITVALQEGIPIMVWRRNGCDPRAFEDELRALLRKGLAELPELTRRLRAHAVASNDHAHVGRHMTVVWDDPERLPDLHPELRAPARVGGPV